MPDVRHHPRHHRRPSAVAPARLLADIAAVLMRETLTILRDPFSLIFSLLQPLVFLGLFGPLLAGVAGDGPARRQHRCSGSCPAWSS